MKAIVPLYTTRGDAAAVYHDGHIFSLRGEWIGWVEAETADVYSVLGYYVGHLTQDQRVLRRRALPAGRSQRAVPGQPTRIRVPARFPLPPMMSEITYSTVDVLDEELEQLHSADGGELREDLG